MGREGVGSLESILRLVVVVVVVGRARGQCATSKLSLSAKYP